jgi:ATP-dependent DNA ligase
MTLPIQSPFSPMEALLVDAIPEGDDYQYEPKWDGFRCLAFRDGERIELQSKSGQPLARYFPDVVEALAKLRAESFVLDGELVIPTDRGLSFEELQLRLHPAASRVAKLAAAHPATLMLFDLLVDERGRSLLDLPLRERRVRLEAFAARHLASAPRVHLSPVTTDARAARDWLERTGGGLDGVVAKRRGDPYLSGERAMRKVKVSRTVDCVVGGFRYASTGRVVGSLLLGLYDDAGRLDYVGFTSALRGPERARLTPKLEALRGPSAFDGARSPGGPSRWSNNKSTAWEPVRPELVVEVAYDQVTGGRFRHGTRLLRFRPDKAPRQCTREQLAPHPSDAWLYDLARSA